MNFKLLLVFFFLANISLAQQNHGIIKGRKKQSNLLCLNGITDGAIAPYSICGGQGLYVTGSDRYKIKSFILLLESTKTIEKYLTGNVVNGDVCEDVSNLKNGDVVYVNKIIAIDNTTGKEVNMPPLRFTVRSPVLDDKRQRFNQQQNEQR